MRRYIHGDGADEPVASYEGAGLTTRYYLHADERGSVVAVSDASGAAVGTSKYSVDGASASLASEFGFTGQLWLPSVQLYYFKARMYSPQLGRFMQRDPLGYAAGLNLYAYAGGDPVNARDPSGLDLEEIFVTCCRKNTYEIVEWGRDIINAYFSPSPQLANNSPSDTEEVKVTSKKLKEISKMNPCGNRGPAPNAELTAQQGIYGAVGGKVSKLFGFEVEINLASYNTPSGGLVYLSHGLSLVLSVGRLRVGGSYEARSYNGGLSFDPSPSNFILGSLESSAEGISATFKPPQIFSGFSGKIENVFSLMPTSDTQCSP